MTDRWPDLDDGKKKGDASDTVISASVAENARQVVCFGARE